MTGTPTEGEVQAMLQNSVAVLEDTRNFIDETLMSNTGGAGLFEAVLEDIEGEYSPALAGAISAYRAGCASLVDGNRALSLLEPVVREYSRLVDSGASYTGLSEIMRAIYEHFDSNSYTVESRNITFDTTATAGASNVGNGGMSRLTVDENGYDLEACHVETKRFRCRGDQNTGEDENAELFEVQGDEGTLDGLVRAYRGSGINNVFIRSKHAGAGEGGSLLNNSSFSSYSASGTPKFTGWTESAGGSYIEQDTVNYYRSHPNAGTNASLKITGGSGTVTLKQTLSQMRTNTLQVGTPYFFRVMLNGITGSASGGTVTIRMGSQTASASIATITGGTDWYELLISPGTGCWPRVFNEDPFDVEIEWSSSSSGYLLVDDVIFAPWDRIDGTYWCLRGNAGAGHTPWLVDDTLSFTDTGGAPATAKIQWWLWSAGLGYLPSTTGTPTITDPA